jgi:excisionase family DNA binding protein
MMGMSTLQQMQQQQQQGQQGQGAQQAGQGAPQMPDVMTPDQVATFLQVSREDVMAAIEAGDLKARKIGNAYRISKANVEEFLAG